MTALADIDNLARTAALSSRFMMAAGDMTYRYDVAWSAIAEETHLTPDASPRWLIGRGQSAISREVHQLQRSAGRDPSGYQKWAPKFWQYWEALPRGGPEHLVVDRVALRQIWWRLDDPQRQVLEALSLHASHAAAAESLGMPLARFTGTLWRARRDFLALWHEGETPSRVWRKTLRGKRQTHCRRGHELGDENVLWRGTPGHRTRTCKTCANESKRRYKQRRSMA